MVDDGLHTYQAAIMLFENSIEWLGQNGIYIIEDAQDKICLNLKDILTKIYQVIITIYFFLKG